MPSKVRRFVRFTGPGPSRTPRWGRLDGDDRVLSLHAAPWVGEAKEADGPALVLSELALLAPAEPTKIVCVGRNFAAHAAELGNAVPVEPLLFLKPPSALIGPGAAIELPPGVGEVHHEAELGVVIGRRLGPRDDPARALSAIAGIACANDVTARAIQRREGKFTRAKGFDTFCALGPHLLAGADPEAERRIVCRVNGEVKQDGNMASMIVGVEALLRFIAGVMTLEPGDLVLCGTPPGVGPIVAGDEVAIEIEALGQLENPVIARPLPTRAR